jgi:hypothetical protein
MKRQYLPDDTLVWFWGNIEAGGSRTLTVTARYDGSKNGQCMINTTTGSMDTPEYPRNAVNDSASATVCAGVQPTVDVQITKAVDKT